MKDSGINVIPIIPENWTIQKIKYVLSERNERAINVSPEELLSVSEYYGVAPRSEKIKTDETLVRADSLEGYKICKRGDMVINIMLAWKGALGTSSYSGVVSPAYCVHYSKNGTVDMKYLQYLFTTDAYKNYFRQHSTGIIESRLRLYTDKMYALWIVCPPLNEQRRIASFLDTFCAEIDAIRADIEKEIQMLEEYKRSVITEAVTKGLDPNVEMKESGIVGCGTIPNSWTISRLSYECYIRARLGWRGLKADEYVDEGYAFISAFNIQNGHLVWIPLNFITKKRYDESPEIKIQKGDVLIVKDGAGVGKSARVDELPMGETAPNSSIAVITPNNSHDYRYICYYLQSMVFFNYVQALYNGMGVPHLTQEIMSKIKMPVPSKLEQKQICDYLDELCNEIDTDMQEKQIQLSMLDEYKKSIIYEYVTGKKEVADA